MKKSPSLLPTRRCAGKARWCALAASLLCLDLQAATAVWDSGAGGGIQAGSGTWDFNTTSNWTLNAGASRVNWTDNADLADFQLQGNTGTVTIDNTSGQVGTGGMTFSGNVGSSSGVWTMGIAAGTSSIQLGAGGVSNRIADGFLLINAPLVLTASQTWTSTRLANNNGVAGVRSVGAISTASGTTNLTFDGLGLSNAMVTGNSSPRVTFDLSGSNSFVGTTTVTGGAVLRLSYGTQNNSKLDDSSALILKGGSIVLNAGSNTVEVVASTTVDSGANNIFAGPSGGGGTTNKIELGALTRNESGTLDITNAVSGIAATTTGNTNGILGGWATMGGSWAVGSADGTTSTNITSTAGTTLNTPGTWTTTANVNVSSTSLVGVTTDREINALRFSGANGGLSIDPAATVQVNSGGIIAASTGQSITGGSLTTGMGSGELFVHTPNAFTISSAIVDNGVTPTILVKAGSAALTLSGQNTYTGATYVNAGTLLISGNATLRGTVTQAGATTIEIGGGGRLSPGPAGGTGTMFLGGNLTLNDGAILDFGLGTSSDLVSLTNSFSTLTGAASANGITLNIFNAGGMSAQTYSLFQWEVGTTLSGFDLADFQVVAAPGITGSLQFGTNSLDYVVSAIPEPSTLLLAALGLTTMLYRTRSRRTR